jgi:protoporphyrinogen/coproporphyrinogen III oxidase
VLIIGAGISGLVCAHALRKEGVDALVVEASARPGGAIQSQRRDGYLLEFGPQSFSGTAPLLKLIADLGLEDDVVRGEPKAPRFVVVDGRLRQVPLTPPALLLSSLLGLKTRWCIVRDFIGNSVPPGQDESVGDFVRRKFSAELLDRLVGPFVSGVFAGDPEQLSVRSAFPAVYEAEKNTGSVTRGLRAKSGEQPRQRPTLLSFREGTESLTRSLAASLGDRLLLNSEVLRVVAREGGECEPFTVVTRFPDYEGAVVADRVVVAAPTNAAASLLSEASPSLSASLAEISYAPLAVVSLGFRRSDIGCTLGGFGFLVARSSGLRTLGTVWNSSLFPDRAPENYVLLTSFIGGATDPQVTATSAGELTSLVEREIGPLLQLRQAGAVARGTNPHNKDRAAASSHVSVYPRALPQYNLGHAERLAAIELHRAAIPNLWLAGNYLRGPSIGACVEQSQQVAQEILSRLKG